MKEIDKMNFENYKKDSENYHKLIKKLVRTLPSEILIQELKRKKLLQFDWIKEKHVELEQTETNTKASGGRR